MTRMHFVPSMMRAIPREPDALRQRIAALKSSSAAKRSAPTSSIASGNACPPSSTTSTVRRKPQSMSPDWTCCRPEVDNGTNRSPNREYPDVRPSQEHTPGTGVPGGLYWGVTDSLEAIGSSDLTAERFIPDPLATNPGRLYDTGDRVRWLPDGQLEFLGRIDDQIKVRGFRVEPGEVEAVLRRHPGVHQAVVVATAQQQLAAYAVPAEGQAPAPTELREFARRHLPDYMVPGLFMLLQHLPLTPSGKLDRRALPAIEAMTSSTYVQPESSMEQIVAAVWADVLRVERVGIQDNFFELGGHSLLAMQVVARLRSAIGVEVPIPVFFNTPTVAGLGCVDRGEPARIRLLILPAVGSGPPEPRRQAGGAAVVRPAAVVVPGPVGARQSVVQHPGRCGPSRGLRP